MGDSIDFPEANPIQRILIHIGEPTAPPRPAPARAPPDWIEADFDQTVLIESKHVERAPEFDKSSGETICTAEGRPQGRAR